MSELPQVKVMLPREIGERPWGSELLIAHGNGYIGKLLLMEAGKAGGLQKHVEKDETSYLLQGSAWVYTDTGDGQLTRFMWMEGTSIHIPPGAVHKVEAIEDCIFFEASSPHFDDRIKLEKFYGLKEGGLPTSKGQRVEKAS
jgi:mannose-6-phosphate isomerase